MIGQRGLYFAIRCAERPDVVMTMMALAKHLTDASTEATATACVASIGGSALLDRSWKICVCQIAASASLQILAIVRTHSSGYSPFAVSPVKAQLKLQNTRERILDFVGRKEHNKSSLIGNECFYIILVIY